MKPAFVKAFALLAFSFVVVLHAAAKDAPSRALRPGIPYSGTVQMFGPESRVTRLGMRIPSDAYAVEFSISGAVADLDIVVSNESGSVIAVAEELDFNESIFLSRIGEPALVSGSLTVEVIYQLAVASRDRRPTTERNCVLAARASNRRRRRRAYRAGSYQSMHGYFPSRG